MKIPGITNMATKAALNTKAADIENKIPARDIFFTKSRWDFTIKDVDSNYQETEKLKKN